jgi:hypothetical protein
MAGRVRRGQPGARRLGDNAPSPPTLSAPPPLLIGERLRALVDRALAPIPVVKTPKPRRQRTPVPAPKPVGDAPRAHQIRRRGSDETGGPSPMRGIAPLRRRRRAFAQDQMNATDGKVSLLVAAEPRSEPHSG